jgi:hypothetical protein
MVKSADGTGNGSVCWANKDEWNNRIIIRVRFFIAFIPAVNGHTCHSLPDFIFY